MRGLDIILGHHLGTLPSVTHISMFFPTHAETLACCNLFHTGHLRLVSFVLSNRLWFCAALNRDYEGDQTVGAL